MKLTKLHVYTGLNIWLHQTNIDANIVQVLVIIEKSRNLAAQQYAIHHFTAVLVVPVHINLCLAWHAAVRWSVRMTRLLSLLFGILLSTDVVISH